MSISKLEVDSVILEFGQRKILSDIYLCSETGRITGVLGRNGSGKSCLMRIIYGVLNAQNSSVRFNGQTFFQAFKKPEKIRYLPQSSFVPKSLSLNKVLRIFECEHQMFFYDFPEFAKFYDEPVRHLSFGQKRLVEIYLILKSKSEFVLLDEPFSYLMPVHVEKLKEILAIEKNKKGIVITDHLYRDLLDIKDDLYLIHDLKSYRIENSEDLKVYGYLH